MATSTRPWFTSSRSDSRVHSALGPGDAAAACQELVQRGQRLNRREAVPPRRVRLLEPVAALVADLRGA